MRDGDSMLMVQKQSKGVVGEVDISENNMTHL